MMYFLVHWSEPVQHMMAWATYQFSKSEAAQLIKLIGM